MGRTLITGAACGLGREIAIHLSKKGYSVVAHYHSSEKEALSLQQEYGVEIIQGDLRDVHSFVKKLNDIENVIHNVGNFIPKKSIDTSEDEWRELFETNVHAPFIINQALFPLKRIVTIGVAGIHRVRTVSYASAYTTTKAALLSYTRSLSRELAEAGTTVNMVSPGVLENSVDLEESENRLPMGRPGELSEVARVVSFLLEDGSGYITGQNIEVAGGLSL